MIGILKLVLVESRFRITDCLVTGQALVRNFNLKLENEIGFLFQFTKIIGNSTSAIINNRQSK